MPEIRRTATEASIIADAQNARAADKLAIIEISISEMGQACHPVDAAVYDW